MARCAIPGEVAPPPGMAIRSVDRDMLPDRYRGCCLGWEHKEKSDDKTDQSQWSDMVTQCYARC